MKSNIGFFTHETDAYDNGKFLILRATYGGEKGWAMEGKFWALNCLIADADNCRLNLNDKAKKAKVVQVLNLSMKELDEFIVILRDECELIHDDDGVIWTQQTQDDLGRLNKLRTGAKNRRDQRNSSASLYDPKTSRDELKKDNDATHVLDGIVLEETTGKIEAVQEVQNDQNLSQKNAACLPEINIKIMEKIKTAPFPSSFTENDIDAFAVRLSSKGLDLGFIDFCIKKAMCDKVGSHAGLLKFGILQYDSWIKEYCWKPEKKPEDHYKGPDTIDAETARKNNQATKEFLSALGKGGPISDAIEKGKRLLSSHMATAGAVQCR